MDIFCKVAAETITYQSIASFILRYHHHQKKIYSSCHNNYTNRNITMMIARKSLASAGMRSILRDCASAAGIHSSGTPGYGVGLPAPKGMYLIQ